MEGLPLCGDFELARATTTKCPFLLHFSSALTGGSSVTNLSHQKLWTGVAFVIGMPHKFSCGPGDDKLVSKGTVEKVLSVEHGAREWVHHDLERGVWVLQAGVLDICA